MNFETLALFSNLTVEQIDSTTLIDISNYIVNQSLSKEKRIAKFLEDTENPYFLKCGNYLIKTSFTNHNLKINDCMNRYINQCLDERL